MVRAAFSLISLVSMLAACGGDDGGGPFTPCANCSGLFVDLGGEGEIDVSLHPSPAATRDAASVVAFAIPFPPDTLESESDVRVADESGSEIASHVESLGDWPSPGGVRAVVLWVEVTFTGDEPVPLKVQFGRGRSDELGDQGDPMDTWSEVSEDDYSVALLEPAAYAVLPAEWLSETLVAGRVAPLGATGWDTFEESLVGSSETAVNEVPPEVVETIDYEADYTAWLFDRSSTLFGVYARTGDFRWLRHAHRAAQYYALHVTDNGYFDFTGDDDLKYAYGQPAVLDRYLTGNGTIAASALNVAEAGDRWNPVYTESANFWTERHQAYALLAAVSAYELTGDSSHYDRATEIIDATLEHIVNPPDSMPKNGCPTHTFQDHEGDARDEAVCSPWMEALLGDAVWRYYLVTRNDDALRILGHMADFVDQYGTYRGDSVEDDILLPWYLASSEVQFSDSGAYDDVEHACDVAGLVARGAYAKVALGENPNELLSTTEELITSCFLVLDYWHRPQGPASGKSEYRLTPPRKFNWWFKTTHEMPWFAQHLGL